MPIELLDEGDLLISTFQQCLRRGQASWINSPPLIKRIIDDGFWRRRTVRATGNAVTFDHFEQFVSAPVPDGLETSIEVLKMLCQKDKNVLDAIDQVVKRPHGGDRSKIDNIQLDPTPTGTSEQAAIRRLRKDRPDLHAKVLGGELSAHAAMVEAGFRDATLTIPSDVVKAAKRLRKHFRGDALLTLIRELQR